MSKKHKNYNLKYGELEGATEEENLKYFNEFIHRIQNHRLSEKIRSRSKVSKSYARNCYICGKTENIQNHHIVKVEWLAELVRKNCLFKVDKDGHIELKEIYIPRADLCEEDHKRLHVLMRDMEDEVFLTDEKAEKYTMLIESVDLKQYEGTDWYEEYNKIWRDKKKVIEENIIDVCEKSKQRQDYESQLQFPEMLEYIEDSARTDCFEGVENYERISTIDEGLDL